MIKLSRLPTAAFLMALGLALPALAASPAAVVTPTDRTAPHAAKKLHRVAATTETAPAKSVTAVPAITGPATGSAAVSAKPMPSKDMPAKAATSTTVPPAGTVAPKTN